MICETCGCNFHPHLHSPQFCAATFGDELPEVELVPLKLLESESTIWQNVNGDFRFCDNLEQGPQ